MTFKKLWKPITVVVLSLGLGFGCADDQPVAAFLRPGRRRGSAECRRARLGLGYLPQEASIFRKLTVEQNILAILEARKDLSRAGRDLFRHLEMSLDQPGGAMQT